MTKEEIINLKAGDVVTIDNRLYMVLDVLLSTHRINVINERGQTFILIYDGAKKVELTKEVIEKFEAAANTIIVHADKAHESINRALETLKKQDRYKVGDMIKLLEEGIVCLVKTVNNSYGYNIIYIHDIDGVKQLHTTYIPDTKNSVLASPKEIDNYMFEVMLIRDRAELEVSLANEVEDILKNK